jgi:hypothetical protein
LIDPKVTAKLAGQIASVMAGGEILALLAR